MNHRLSDIVCPAQVQYRITLEVPSYERTRAASVLNVI